MQEQVNEKTIALQVSTVRVTTRVLRMMLAEYLRYRRDQKLRNPNKISPKNQGSKTTLEKLTKKYDGLKSIEITEKNIRDFERTAKKYRLEYALKKDTKASPPTYFVFFKGKDLDVIDFAFREYLKGSLEKVKDTRPSVRESLNKMKEKIGKFRKDRVKTQKQEQSL